MGSLSMTTFTAFALIFALSRGGRTHLDGVRPYLAPASSDASGRSEKDCDHAIYLRRGESFAIREFPPSPSRAVGLYTRGPRECTWIFKSVGGCQLVYQTTSFERGNVDCEEEYFVIGDEFKEQRVCGFKHPPNTLHSIGDQLFLTHYQRRSPNYARRATSQIEGQVHCQRPPPPPPPPACVPPVQALGVRGDIFGCSPPPNGACHLVGSIETHDGGGARVEFNASCTAGFCSATYDEYFALVPLTQTCDTPFPPLPSDIGTCSNASLTCPKSAPNCDYTLTVRFLEGETTDVESHTCAFGANQTSLCTVRVQFCIN